MSLQSDTMPSQQQPRLERTDKMSSTKAVQTRKPASKRVATPKKKAAARNPPTQKKAIKTTASMKNTVVKVATRKTAKPVPKKKIVAKKSPTQKGEAKKVVTTRSAPQKVPQKRQPQKKPITRQAVAPELQVKVLPPVTTEWVGISAMKAISCPECEAHAGELCVAEDTGKVLWWSHPARIVAYTTNRLVQCNIISFVL